MARTGFGGTREKAIVKISGEAVEISGEIVTVLQSGAIKVLQSGTPAVGVSGETVIISGQPVSTTMESGSIVTVSGNVVTVLQSGTLVTTASGDMYTVLQSGAVTVLQSGTPAVSVSGNVVDIKVPTEVKTYNVKTVLEAAASGSAGVVLHSGAVVSVTLKALSGNSGDIYVGGATNVPYSGFGFCLEPGEAVNLDVSDFGDVYVGATISGDKVTFFGIA